MDDKGPWHIRAVRLPEATDAEDWWVVDGQISSRPTEGARELPGGWMLPGGLVDAHVHLTMNFGRLMPHADGSDALVAANQEAQRRAGVLAVRDAGYAWGGVPREAPDGPRLQRAGSLMAPAGRGYLAVCRAVSAEDLVTAALMDVEQGAAWVKVIGDFPGNDGNWFAAPLNYPLPLLRTLVTEVHAAGARVMAHTTGLGAAELVAAGVDAIEHGMVLTRDLIEEMAARGIAWTLTLATAHKHVGPLAAQQTPVGVYIRGHLDRIREQVPLARSLGVPFLAGSDELPHGSFAQELQLLTQFGLTPGEALAVGSAEARAVLGFPPVGVGTSAEFVTYDADPRRDLGVLDNPAAVVFGGRRIL